MKLQIRKSKFRSSQEMRDAAKTEHARLKAKLAEIMDKLKAIKDPLPEFIKAAEFVCDVNGDHPSIDTLRDALAIVKHQRSLRDERMEVEKQRAAIAGEMCRYQWSAGENRGMFFHVLGHGDTKHEAVTMAEKASQ